MRFSIRYAIDVGSATKSASPKLAGSDGTSNLASSNSYNLPCTDKQPACMLVLPPAMAHRSASEPKKRVVACRRCHSKKIKCLGSMSSSRSQITYNATAANAHYKIILARTAALLEASVVIPFVTGRSRSLKPTSAIYRLKYRARRPRRYLLQLQWHRVRSRLIILRCRHHVMATLLS